MGERGARRLTEVLFFLIQKENQNVEIRTQIIYKRWSQLDGQRIVSGTVGRYQKINLCAYILDLLCKDMQQQ